MLQNLQFTLSVFIKIILKGGTYFTTPYQQIGAAAQNRINYKAQATYLRY